MKILTEYTISSVAEFAQVALDIANAWHLQAPPWFRGQMEENREKSPLLPKVFQNGYKGRENEFVQVFRMRAQQYGWTPDFSRIDQWLFLMQHVGLPTRLLDWTEGALIALYFAVNRYSKKCCSKPVVWELNPLFLNIFGLGAPGFSLTWLGQKHPQSVPIGHITAAFEKDPPTQPKYPAAIYPQPVHPRVTAQRGTFTIHGGDKRSLDSILSEIDDITAECDIRATIQALDEEKLRKLGNPKPEKILNDMKTGKFLCRLIVDCNDRETFLRDLRSLGVTQSTLFPELDGLAAELKHLRTEIF